MDEKKLSEQIIQWYPGHMTKTRRRMSEDIKQVDAVVEIIDARIPVSSRNPDIDMVTAGKPRVVLLNKADYADERMTEKWRSYFTDNNVIALACDCRSGKGLNRFIPSVKKLLSERIEYWTSKGMKGRYIKLMVAGIPNVGKSSFINRMASTKKAKVADRPGVTRGNQWFSIPGSNVELLDTPGVLWPKFEDQTVAKHLAFTGAIKDTVIDTETLCCELIALLGRISPDSIKTRYKLDAAENMPPAETLSAIAKKRGMLVSGGDPDTERAAAVVLDEYRGGKLGRFTLEQPPEKE